MTILLRKVIESPIPVIDGYVEFEDPEIGIAYRIKVKQMQSHGAAYADKISVPDADHLEIIDMMLSTEFLSSSKFSRQQLFNQLKLWRSSNGVIKEVKTSPFGARLSELVRKTVLYKTREEGTVMYQINAEYARTVRESGKF